MAEKRSIRDGNKGSAKARGFSLLELMIASVVLTVGILGGILVIGMATANNGRSKFHTNAASLAGSTMEKILVIPSTATGVAAQTQITDCAGNTFTINTAQGGAPLITNGAFSGLIDFSQPPQPNYSMVYSMCSSSSGQYDVRWNVGQGPTLNTQLITVAARSIGVNQGAMLTLPYNLHQVRGDF